MKKNVVLFTCADGREEKFSLKMLIERGAVVVNKVNGEDIAGVMGGANQLWIPGLPAKYFLRDIVRIEFLSEQEEPVLPDFVDDGRDYQNRPNVAAACDRDGRVGFPLKIEGWADDFDKAISGVEFSVDGGASWSFYETPQSVPGKITTWSFSWTPSEPGDVAMMVRAVNEDGVHSPVAAICRTYISD